MGPKEASERLRHTTLGLFSFLISLIAYSWIGFLWILYNNIYATASGISTTSGFATATAIQEVVFVSIIAALATALVAYLFERGLHLAA